jgi:hypothetical protein
VTRIRRSASTRTIGATSARLVAFSVNGRGRREPSRPLLGAASGVLGVALGFLVNGARVNVMTASTRFPVTPTVAAAGLLLSIAAGVLGGLSPALGRRGSASFRL